MTPTSNKTLSPREEEILRLAAEGLIDKQIGQRLGLRQNTLNTYWARIRSKVGRLTRPALVAWYGGLQRTKPLDHHSWTPVRKSVVNEVTATSGKVIRILDPGILPAGSEPRLYSDDLETVIRNTAEFIKGPAATMALQYRIVCADEVYHTSTVFQKAFLADGTVKEILMYSVDTPLESPAVAGPPTVHYVRGPMSGQLLYSGGLSSRCSRHTPRFPANPIGLYRRMDAPVRNQIRHHLKSLVADGVFSFDVEATVTLEGRPVTLHTRSYVEVTAGAKSILAVQIEVHAV